MKKGASKLKDLNFKELLFGNADLKNTTIPDTLTENRAYGILNAIKAYQGTVKEFLTKKSDFFISDHEVDVVESLGEKLKDDATSADTLIDKSKELAKAQEKVANSFSAKGLLGKGWDLLKGLGSTLLNVAGGLLVEAALSATVAILDNIIHRQEKIIEKGKEAQKVISEYKDSYDSKKNFADSNTEDFLKLREGIEGDTNKNKSLSTEDYEKFLSLNNQMAELFPQLVVGYDSQGNALLNLASGAGEAAGQIEQLVEQERSLADFKIAENLQDVVNGTYEQSKILTDELEFLYEQKESLESAKKDFDATKDDSSRSLEESFTEFNTHLGSDSKTSYSDYRKVIGDFENAEEVYTALQKAAKTVDKSVTLGNGVGEYVIQNMTKEEAARFYDAYITNLKGASAEISTDLSGQLSEIGSQINVDEREAAALWNAVVPSLLSSMQVYDGYNELSDGIKQLINTAIGNIDYGEIPEADRKNLHQYLRKTLLDPILDMDDETRSTFDDVLDLYQNETLTIAEKTEAIKSKIASSSADGKKLIMDSLTSLGLSDGVNFDTTNGKLDELLGRSNNVLSRDQISNMTDAEFSVYYSLVVDKGKTFKDAESALTQVQNLVKTTTKEEKVTFADLLGLDDEGNQSTFSKNIDDFQDKISSIQTILDQLKTGEEVDLTDLLQQFPELSGKTDNLSQSLNDLKYDTLKDFGRKWASATSNLTGDELNKATETFRNLINSVDLSDIDFSKLSASDLLGTRFIPTFERPFAEEAMNKVLSDFGGSHEGLEVIAKLSLNPESATWTYEDWKAQIEASMPEIELRENQKQIDNLGNSLTNLQTEASAIQDALNLKDARGVQKVAKDYDGLIQNSRDQILNLRETNELLLKQQEKFGPLDAGYQDIQSQIDANNASIRAAIQSQIEWNKAASELPVQDSSMLNAYTAAQSSANASDSYNTIVSGKKGADELWDQGWVGKDDFTTYAQLLAQEGETLYEAVSNYEVNAERMSKYLTEDTSGLYNFLDDAVAKSTELGKEWVTLGEDGKYAFDIDNLSDFAKEMGMTSELAGHFFVALRDMGMEVDMSMIGDNFAEQFSKVDYTSNNAAQQVKNLVNEMETLSSADIDITGSVDDAAKALKTLDEQGVDVSGMLEQLNELGNMNGFHINDDFTVTFTKLQSAYDTISQYQDLSVNVDANVDGDLDTLVNDLLGMGQETLISIGFKPADGETITAEDIKNQIGTVEVPIEYQNNGDTSNDATIITVDANTDSFTQKVNDAENDANNRKPTMNVDADPSSARSKVNSLVSDIESMNPQISVGATTGGITSSINNALSGPFSISVSASISGLPNKLFTGTMLSPAHASGTAYNMLNLKPAYANGEISLSQDEQALVNELGKLLCRYKIYLIAGKPLEFYKLQRTDEIS